MDPTTQASQLPVDEETTLWPIAFGPPTPDTTAALGVILRDAAHMMAAAMELNLDDEASELAKVVSHDAWIRVKAVAHATSEGSWPGIAEPRTGVPRSSEARGQSGETSL